MERLQRRRVRVALFVVMLMGWIREWFVVTWVRWLVALVAVLLFGCLQWLLFPVYVVLLIGQAVYLLRF